MGHVRHRVIRTATVILVTTAAFAACGSSGDDDDALDPPGGENTTTGAVAGDDAPATAAFADFGLDLQAGSWWEFGFRRTSSSYAQGSGGSSSAATGRFLITLGASERIGGSSLHAVEVTPLEGDAPDDIIRWRYLGMDGSLLVGSTDGVAVQPVFDPTGDVQAGGGFFVEFAADELTAATPTTARWSDEVLAELPPTGYDGVEAIELTDSFSESRCEYFADVGNICAGDRDQSSSVREYLHTGVGPLGMYRQSSYSDCGGGFCSGSSRMLAIVLLDHGLDGRPPPVAVTTTTTATTTTTTSTAAPPALPDSSPDATIRDDTGSISVDVPASWTDIRTAPRYGDDGSEWPTIVAAPDRSGFEGSYDGPGATIQIGPPGERFDDLTGWFETFTAADQANCTRAARETSDDLETMVLVDCAGRSVVLSWVAGHVNDRPYWFVVQVLQGSDPSVFDRFVESLTICERNGCLVG